MQVARSSISRESPTPRPWLTPEDYRDVFDAMLRHRYFTNHGPLAIEFESALESFLDIEHVVTVGSESLAILIALAAMEIKGEILLPAFGGDAIFKMARRLGLNVNWSDVCENSYQSTPDQIIPRLTDQTEVVVLIEMFGHRLPFESIDAVVQRGLQVIVLALDSLGAIRDERRVSLDENVVTIFSFNQGRPISAMQGGAVATPNAILAEKIRNTRSSYGTREKISVKATCNGRFSEFQAGLGLKSLERLDARMTHMKNLASVYQAVLHEIPELVSFIPSADERPNYQCLPIQLADSLSAESWLADWPAKKKPVRVGELSDAPNFPNSAKAGSQICLLPLTPELEIDACYEFGQQCKATLSSARKH